MSVPILSIILPVYKVEAYVGACLDSIHIANDLLRLPTPIAFPISAIPKS